MKPALSGIYFLFSGDRVVYIGQSSDIYRRIYEHRTGHLSKCKKKEFDSFEYIEIDDPIQKDRAEFLLINMFHPVYNDDYSAPKRPFLPPNKKEKTMSYARLKASRLDVFLKSISMTDCDEMIDAPRGTFYSLYYNKKIPSTAIVTDVGPLMRIDTVWFIQNFLDLRQKYGEVKAG